MVQDHYPKSASINPIIDAHGILEILDYICLFINRVSGEPIFVVIEGLDAPQYARNLYAQLVPSVTDAWDTTQSRLY